jgi:hypothetical protein
MILKGHILRNNGKVMGSKPMGVGKVGAAGYVVVLRLGHVWCS